MTENMADMDEVDGEAEKEGKDTPEVWNCVMKALLEVEEVNSREVMEEEEE
jgi:hypothetical protein